MIDEPSLMCGIAALAGQPKQRIHVRLHHPVELLGADAGDPAVLRHLERGVADQHVDPPELPHRRVHHLLADGLAAQVTGQDAVGGLGPHSEYESFGEAIRSRTAWRDLHGVDPGPAMTASNAVVNSAGAVADEEPEGGGALVEVYCRSRVAVPVVCARA
jgi:hypothetical protein